MNKYSLSVIAVDDRQTPVMLIGQHYYAIADLNPALAGDTESGLLPIVSNWQTASAALEELATTLSTPGHGTTTGRQFRNCRVLQTHLLPNESDVCRLQLR